MRQLSAVLATICLAATAACGGPESTTVEQPDILLISIDTLRADHVGAYGYQRPTTPRIDEIAGRGVVFEQAYAQAPYTSASHASMLTSMFPSVHGVWKHGQALDPEIPVLPAILGAAGYDTAGFTQLNGPTYSRGFDVWERLGQHRKDINAEDNLAAITGWIDQERAAPYFLFLHFYDVHLPYKPRKDYADRFSGDYSGPFRYEGTRDQVRAVNRGELEASAADIAQIVALYDAELAFLDDLLGRVFDHLRNSGRLDKTVVVLMSDHGEEFGEHGKVGLHGHNLYNELLLTPLIIAAPGWPAGRVAEPVRNIDIAPTLLEFANLPAPASFQGASLAGMWTEPIGPSRVVLAEMPTQRAFVADGMKYTRTADGRELVFDLREDPGELVNLATVQPDDLERLRQLADAWDEELSASAARVRHSSEVTLTPEEERRLRALGYLQ